MLKPNQTLLFEGDSITKRTSPPHHDTWPFLRLMAWDQTWADKLGELLFAWHPELKLKTINNAVGGSNINGMSGRLDNVLAKSPDWIICTIGHNDPNHNVTLEAFEKGIAEYLRRVNEATNGACRVVFLGGLKPPGHASIPYYEILQKLTAGTRHHYLDAGTAMREKAALLREQYDGHTIYGDGAHLNALGALILAGEVYKFFFPT